MKGYLLANINTGQCILSKNPDSQFEAASLTKVLYASEIVKKATLSDIITVTKDQVVGYGTDVLPKLFLHQDSLHISIDSLLNLMLTYSCNTSTRVLLDYFFPVRETILSQLSEYNLESTELRFENKEIVVNKTTLQDLFRIYTFIFNNVTLTEFFTKKNAINIFYLFDQIPISLVTSKTGMVKENNIYTVGNTGVVTHHGEYYFLGGYSSANDIRSAVIALRNSGKTMFDHLHNI
jgi:hypothetical protein